jgi:RNA polymerase sigma-70 factor (ECF subfamily)
MADHAHPLVERSIGVDDTLGREFEARLVESSTLAFRVAFSVLRHREDAEDVAQEALARAYRSFRSLRDRDRFRAWLVRMTWRLALDRQRADRRRARRELTQMPPTTPVEDARSAARLDALWRAIDALPTRWRLVLVLANVEGHGVAEVGRLLGLPDGTVKSRLFHARRKLKEIMDGGTPGS